MRRILTLALLSLVVGGCYHATINTGIAPGTQQLDQPWASSWVYGLVPPPTVNAMATCGSAGVAVVETQQSFVNGLVGVLTFGIYTPMQITVTCGQGEDQEDLTEVTSASELRNALDRGDPFFIRSANLP